MTKKSQAQKIQDEQQIPEEGQFLTVGGASYRIKDLPPDIQQLLRIFQKCEKNLLEKQDEIFLIQVSSKTLATEIEMRIKAFADSTKVQVTNELPVGESAVS